MASARQKAAARENIKKAQAVWRGMSSRAHALAQPEGGRKKPGATGEGDFYHVQVRPRSEFTTFRTQDVGERGGIERVSGKRSSGSWATQKWLIGKEHAHIEDDRLIPDTAQAREVLESLGAEPKRIGADRFEAKARPNVPESEKPTPAQTRARRTNIKNAQAARHSH